MSSVWDGIRKAAATGAAKAQAAAENAVHRMEIQRKIAHNEAELTHSFTALGRETYTAARDGAQLPDGLHVDVAALSAVEAEIARLKTELATYSGAPAAAEGQE